MTGRVTAASINQTHLFNSYTWQKLFEWHTQLRLFPKQIICQSYFMFWIIFTKWIWFVNCFKCVSDGNVWPPGQRAEIRKRIASESLQKLRTKFCEVAGHVCRVKTVVANHLRKIFRSRIHKAAECNITPRINWDKLTETISFPARNQSGAGGVKPPRRIFALPEKYVGQSLKLLDIIKEIWAPLGKHFAPPGVPSRGARRAVDGATHPP